MHEFVSFEGAFLACTRLHERVEFEEFFIEVIDGRRGLALLHVRLVREVGAEGDIRVIQRPARDHTRKHTQHTSEQ